MAIMQQKLKLVKTKLKNWKKTTFGNIFNAKEALEKDLEKLQEQIIKEGHTKEKKEKEKDMKS